MADVVVSTSCSILATIISLLGPCCTKHTSYLCKLKENKKQLEEAKKKLISVRNVVKTSAAMEISADPRKKLDERVSKCLEHVEIVDGEVEKILKKADEQLNEGRCLGGCFPKNVCSNYKVNKSVAKKIESVVKLKDELEEFKVLTDRKPPSLVEEIMDVGPTVGMDTVFDEVWSWINDKPDSNIIGLYGQGGVGKTTLLEKINNKFHNNLSNGVHGFDSVVIFVVVSKQVNYEAIQKNIGERLGLSDSLKEDGDDVNNRAKKISKALKEKNNYVLLLDDIWEDNSKDQLIDKIKRIGIPIPPQGNSSKVIFTTRSEKVCGLMEATRTFQVKCLHWEEALSLFQKNVGKEALKCLSGARQLQLVKDVAKECGGLPLALIAIGRAMSRNNSVDDWKDAERTLQRYASKFKDMREKVLASLELSYDYLDGETVKSCFRYCSLYPEDYSIETAKLVDYWLAEGFLDELDNLSAARIQGRSIIRKLKSACMLESSDKQNHEKTHVKMHHVIRNLALWIVNRSTDQSHDNLDNKYLVAVNDPCQKWANAERIFWDATHNTTRSSSNLPPTSTSTSTNLPPKSKNLLTLLVKCGNYKWPQSFFKQMPCLRVLDLSNACSFNNEFPISICDLVELQYLNLSGMSIKELPVELKNLVKLKFLVSHRLRRIPAGLIANLSKLQVLDLGCDDDDNDNDHGFENGSSFSELDDLTQLQEVRITIKTNVALETFLCNKKLQMVCTSLKLILFKSLQTLIKLQPIRVLDLSKFKSLKDLKLIGEFSELEELVLYGSITDEGLLSNLETLSLKSFSKLKSILAAQPGLLHSHFQSLHCISIDRCDALKNLTWLVYVENLKELTVWKCKGLETIIEFGDDGLEGASGGDQMLNTGGGGGGVFQRLKTLYLYQLPKLKSICRHALDFPFIETISILNCPELKKLPLGSSSNVENLKQIYGGTEWWNDLLWGDVTIESKFLPYLKKV